ncbi:unnamed protein product [Arabis nemorensis]|uniref:Uncharacterized protein n=1 Tax=Arabis nemorensis TaxID=586526 RepID=A0A565BC77_9BRAS|nr:unnamed protein product [Arabis nemorensis]
MKRQLDSNELSNSNETVHTVIMVSVEMVPDATNSLCGYKVVASQPSDLEDFSKLFKDFTKRHCRLISVKDLTKATMKKLTQ